MGMDIRGVAMLQPVVKRWLQGVVQASPKGLQVLIAELVDNLSRFAHRGRDLNPQNCFHENGIADGHASDR